MRYIRCGIGTPCLRDHIGRRLGQWGTPLRRPHWLSHAQNDPCRPYITMQKLHLHTFVISVLDSISMCKVNRFIVDLSETPRYFGSWYRDTRLRDHKYVVSANGGRHYVAPHWLVPHPEWSLLTLYPCTKTSLSCCILLCSVTFTVFQCVSWTALW